MFCFNGNRQPFYFYSIFLSIFFGGLEIVGHSVAHVAHFLIFFRDVWIRTQNAAVASRRAANLATHLSNRLSKTKTIPYSLLEPHTRLEQSKLTLDHLLLPFHFYKKTPLVR